MRYVCVALVLMGFGLAAVSITRADNERPEANDRVDAKEQKTESTSSTDDGPLLLLDDPAGGDPKKSGADNSRCHVCHLNFAMEKIAVIHAREKIGCSDCHGDCDDHIADESWASGGPGTAPDIMYPRDTIDAACGKCHPTHDVPANAVLERWRKRCPDLADVSKIVCTDCHGHHRVNPELRKAHWDKKTGEPITGGALEES